MSLPAVVRRLTNRDPTAWQKSPFRNWMINSCQPASGGSTDIRWLVGDHLGTPRMIFDQTGSLAGVSRHDYLPFGEELYAGTGGRTTQQGYLQPDGVRNGQKA